MFFWIPFKVTKVTTKITKVTTGHQKFAKNGPKQHVVWQINSYKYQSAVSSLWNKALYIRKHKEKHLIYY